MGKMWGNRNTSSPSRQEVVRINPWHGTNQAAALLRHTVCRSAQSDVRFPHEEVAEGIQKHRTDIGSRTHRFCVGCEVVENM
eukprot:scaffold2360_cov113-Cylindrotheca_fusiformis.AAC.2